MDRTKLKYLAVLLMLFDHIGALIPMPTELYWLLRCLGRASFPIFAWMVAEGLHKTGDQRAYLKRLGLFALLSELPFLAAFLPYGEWLSVLVTFLLAGLAMQFYEKLRETTPLATALLPLLAALALAELLHADYGAGGVLLVAAFYLMDDHKRHKLWFLGLWCAATYLVFYPLPALLSMLPAGLMTPNLADIFTLFLRELGPSTLALTAASLASVPLLNWYSGEPGTGHKWFFYWFYPAHLLVLAALQRLIPVLR